MTPAPGKCEIHEIAFRFGSSPAAERLVVQPSSLTVFVGPNNGGKSLTLKEIHSSLFTDQHMNFAPKHCIRSEHRVVIGESRITVNYSRDQILSELTQADNRSWYIPGSLIDDPKDNFHIGDDYISQAAKGLAHAMQTGQNIVLRRKSLLLDGATRLALLKDQLGGDLKLPARTVVQALLLNDQQRNKWRHSIFEALGWYPVLDPTDLQKISVSLSREAPRIPLIERSFTEEALNFFKKCVPLSRTSDGVKAYCGICAAVMSADYDVIFIDEPEAFLHPPLIRRLAKLLCQTADEQKTSLFVATHSADFVMGCVQSGIDVNVVRLTYDGTVATARLLAADRLAQMMKDPLLRSTGVLNALFHQGAVVCEGDADRAFYQEINERLLNDAAGGSDSCLFLNCHSWQSIAKIVGPLRELGIPTAAIVDFDVVLTDQMPALLKACSIPQLIADGFNAMRSRLTAQSKIQLSFAGADDKEWKQRIKREGLRAFSGELSDAAEKMLRDLADYGIFVVPVGELERWLPQLSVGGHGPPWLIEIFERMRSNVQAPDYVRPESGDVWAFLTGVLRWVEDRRARR